MTKVMEIYLSTSLEVCEQRDQKGLYRLARLGEIKNFTGISDPYEIPPNPDLVLDTNIQTVFECCQLIIQKILHNSNEKNELINPSSYIKLNINIETMNWLQIIQQGWCPNGLQFMNETQLLECIYFKTYTDSNKIKHLQSIPITMEINDIDDQNLILEAMNLKKDILLFDDINKRDIAVLNNPNTFEFP